MTIKTTPEEREEIRCNKALGFLDDNVDSLRRAITWVEER